MQGTETVCGEDWRQNKNTRWQTGHTGQQNVEMSADQHLGPCNVSRIPTRH